MCVSIGLLTQYFNGMPTKMVDGKSVCVCVFQSALFKQFLKGMPNEKVGGESVCARVSVGMFKQYLKGMPNEKVDGKSVCACFNWPVQAIPQRIPDEKVSVRVCVCVINSLLKQ